MKPSPAALQAIVGRVKTASEIKLAGGPPTKADTGDVADPTERGNGAVKEDPDAAPGKQGLPENQKNTEGGVPADDQTLQPSTTGKNVPSTESQNAKDEAAKSPTDDLGKIAARVSRVNQLAAGIVPAAEPAKAASTPAPAAATPAAATPAAVTPPAPTAGNKSASTPENGEFGTETLAKLGSLLLASEGGAEKAAALFEKEAGEKEAADMIRLAVAEHAGVTKLANQADNTRLIEYLEGEKRAATAAAHQEAVLKQAAELYQQATPEEKAFIDKLASYSAWADKNIPHPILKFAFEAGMADATQDLETLEDGGQPPTGEEPVSPEQILELVQAAVDAGELDPQTAEALMAQLAGSEGGLPPEEGMAQMDEEMKAASAIVG